MPDIIDNRPGPVRVTDVDGLTNDGPRLPPPGAAIELHLIFVPGALGTTVTVMQRATRGPTRWTQRTGILRFPEVPQDVWFDPTRGLGATCRAVAAYLEA